MGWAETARRVAEFVVRPVVVKDEPEKQEMGVGLFIGEDCRFAIPSEAHEQLTEDLRQIVELAIIKAWGWEKLVGSHLD